MYQKTDKASKNNAFCWAAQSKNRGIEKSRLPDLKPRNSGIFFDSNPQASHDKTCKILRGSI